MSGKNDSKLEESGHTPDFLVLRKAGASFEEWKPAQALETLVIDMPNRYQWDGGGKWHCLPGEAWTQQVGLSYQVRSSAEYHPLYIQNLKFLHDFWAHPLSIDPEQEQLVLSLVDTHRGIRLSEAKEATPISADLRKTGGKPARHGSDVRK